MPAVGATQNSLNVPSIGQMLSAFPKALVGLAAVFSGITNACSTTHQPSGQHGGGLQTEANARWQNHWLPKMQACLSKPWTHRFEPDRIIIECTLRGITQWQQENGDIDATEVVTRGLAYHHLTSPDPVPETSRPTPGALKKVVGEVATIMHSTDEFEYTMEKAKKLLWFHSSIPWSDLANSRRHTADRLIKLLDDDLGLDSFMDEACPLSFRLHEMVRNAGNLVDRLKPELMRSQADREAFEKKVDNDFVARDASMGKRQLRVLLSLLARHMNEKNSQMVS